MDWHSLGEIIAAIVLLGLKHLADRQDAQRRDRVSDNKMSGLKTEVLVQLRELKTTLIGLDGNNGMRGDLRDIATRVDGIEERELERAEKPARSRRRA